MDSAQQMQHLYQNFGHLQGVEIELHKRLIAIAINNKAARATIFLQGAQIAEFVPHGQNPVLWLSDECNYQAGQSLRGGIPICWPWFGDLARNPAAVTEQYTDIENLPAHGLVRERLWQLDSIAIIDAATTEVNLSLDVAADERFPYNAKLHMSLRIGEQLSCIFKITNTGSDTFHFSSALHTYLAVEQIEDVTLTGLEGVNYLDTLDEWREKSEDHTVAINAETDRIYQNVTQAMTLTDSIAERKLTLTSQGFKDAVLWNPWIEKSKRLSQFADQAYKQMICVESANVLENICELAPEQVFSTTLTIECSDADKG